jgi:hypothetical protein
MGDMTWVIHLAVLLGVVVVLPMATSSWERWRWAGLAVAASVLLPTGPGAAAAAAVWVAVALCGLWAARHPASGEGWLDLAAAAYATSAGVAFVTSRGGWRLLDIGEPIVELTAVHFTYAGVGALWLARAAGPRRRRLRTVAVGFTVTAPPVVASGFLLGHPLPQVGGAVLMSMGVLLTALLQLLDVRGERGATRGLLLLSGVAPWVPMGLAVSWAAGQHWDVPALSVPDMVRTHGVANAAFVVAGLLARRAPIRRSGSAAVVAATGPA